MLAKVVRNISFITSWHARIETHKVRESDDTSTLTCKKGGLYLPSAKGIMVQGCQLSYQALLSIFFVYKFYYDVIYCCWYQISVANCYIIIIIIMHTTEIINAWHLYTASY